MQSQLNYHLNIACEENHTEIAGLLISHGADVNFKDTEGKTPLHHTCRYGYLELTKLLVEKGADFNTEDWEGETPLRLVCRWGHLEITKFIVSLGVDINSKRKIGCYTPLHISCDVGYLEVSKFLIEKGADINAKNRYNETPLDLLIIHKQEILQFILEKKIGIARLFQRKKCGIVVSGKILGYLFGGDETDNMRIALNS